MPPNRARWPWTPRGPGTGTAPIIKALLAHLENPDLEVGLLFRKVRETVLKITEGRQEPVVYGALSGTEFHLGTLAAGKTFRDCPDCPEMTVIAAGGFTTGSPPDQAGQTESEGPQHPVMILKPFAVGKYEVTRGEFARFVEESGYAPGASCAASGGTDTAPSTGAQDAERSWRNPGFEQADRDPVVCVSWQDAQAYAYWLSKKTGRVYRLLSEAEWEYAARAGTDGPFQFGATISTDRANFDGSRADGSGAKGIHRKRTVPVGSFPANPFGLHDLHGNAAEWVEDCWHEIYPAEKSEGKARTAGGDCTRRVLRGGGWNAAPQDLRVTARSRNAAGTRSNAIGFRVARALGR